MSELGLTPDEVASYLSQFYLDNYLLLPALVLVVYDTMLTLAQEVQCIWQRKFSGVTLLYILIRYGTLLNMLMQLAQIFWIFKTPSSCETLNIVVYTVDVACLFAMAAFNCLRIWALCQQRWLPVILVCLLSMFTPCINIYNLSRPQIPTIVDSGPLIGCWTIFTSEQYIYLPVITRAISVGADLLVLGFTLLETIYGFKPRQALEIKARLIILLVKNGALQFIVFSILNVILVILDTLAIADLSIAASQASGFVVINESITAILLSHFLLDLRSIYQSEDNGTDSEEQGSSIHFAASILGNMGATLDTFWTREESVFNHHQSVIYSDNPFHTGLLETVAEEQHAQKYANEGASDLHVQENAILNLNSAPPDTLIAAGHIELQNMA